MRGILRIAAVSISALLASCANLPHKVEQQKTFAMVNADQKTDQHLISLFRDADGVIIRSGSGGEVDGMIETLKFLDAHPEKFIVVDGPCFSACTLLLSRPKSVVFTERATFHFHSARIEWRDKEGNLVKWELSWDGNEKMMDVFPEQIQMWIYENDAFYSREFTSMDNATVRSLLPSMFMNSKRIPDHLNKA